jgi:hypothetical protein
MMNAADAFDLTNRLVKLRAEAAVLLVASPDRVRA